MVAHGRTATSGCQFRSLDGGISSHQPRTNVNSKKNPNRILLLLYFPTTANKPLIPKMPAIHGRRNSGRLEYSMASAAQPVIASKQKRARKFPNPLNHRTNVLYFNKSNYPIKRKEYEPFYKSRDESIWILLPSSWAILLGFGFINDHLAAL